MAINRRAWLQHSACGFGSLAFSALLQGRSGLARDRSASSDPTLPMGLHHRPRAKRMIFLFMQGGPSQVDTFDYKPLLAQRHGEAIDFNDDRTRARSGNTQSTQKVMQSPWNFQQYGQTGRWVSALFPRVATQIDSLCMIHSMHTEGVAHGPATLFLHCGAMNVVRPSVGAWIQYGLGSENENLPGFVTIAPSAGNGGPRNYGAAFLPAQMQGTPIGRPGSEDLSIRNLAHAPKRDGASRQHLELIQRLSGAQRAFSAETSRDPSTPYEAILRSYELAWGMQQEAPEVFDLRSETQQTLEMYGIGAAQTSAFGRQCLLARRLCEAGVRYIQVNYGDNSANPAWDQHSDLPQHAAHAQRVDQPIAALLADLRQRGLLDDTLVWWGAEFGRTPYAQDNGTGRDHNPSGFTMWLCGGGVRAGLTYGATDAFGHQAIEDKVHMHDLHATILHLLGIDHTRLTYPYAGREFRLTDVHGRVIDALLA